MIPIAGSAYTYGYATLGEFVAWIIGWDLILEYLFAARLSPWAGPVMSCRSRRTRYRHSHLPHGALKQCRSGGGWNSTGCSKVGLDWRRPQRSRHGDRASSLCYNPHRESANFNNVIAGLHVILTFIAVGAAYINAGTGAFVPAPAGPQHGWDGVVRAAGGAIFAHRLRRSRLLRRRRTSQRRHGMLASSPGNAITSPLVLTGIKYSELGADPSPAIDRLARVSWLRPIIKGAIAGLSSVILVMMFGQVHFLRYVQTDSLSPASATSTLAWTSTTIPTGAGQVMLPAPIGLLGELVSIDTVGFTIVCWRVRLVH
jgi:APA family basic amino acid/polyamine antiporter